ncbi:MAG: S4 domain-containing protein [Pseudomonadota bacterium]
MADEAKPQEDARLRIDKWLWAARFFKTRSLASEAVSGGRVHVERERVKSSRPVKVGDRVMISRGSTMMEVVVEAISERRGSATDAAKLYRETDESRERREREAAQRHLARQLVAAPQRRPDKKERRQLARIRRGGDTPPE